MVIFVHCVSSFDLPQFLLFYLLQLIWFLDHPSPHSLDSLLSGLHVIPSFRFPIFLNTLFPSLPPSQPPLLSTLHLPCPPLEVALPLPSLPPPLPLLLPPPPPRSPTVWRPRRQRLDCCLPCWRTRPGGFMPRRPSCSSAWLWVSGACDIDSNPKSPLARCGNLTPLLF